MKVLVITNMYPNPDQPAFGTFVKDQVEALRQTGIEVDVLFINGRQHKLNYLWGIFRFWWRLLYKRYHLIHAHYAITGLIARLQFFYPVIVTYHGGEVKDHSPGWLKFLARRGPRLFNRIIVVNRHEKELIQDNTNVRVIPCGVNFNEFKPMPMAEARELLELPLDKPLILWAGEYWQPEKRFELVKTSVEILKQHCTGAELLLVSGKPHTVVPVYMAACDALVLASFSEGSPMVIKEAMACNLPIVSTDVGDVAEIIDGVKGCYLAQPDPVDIAHKLFAAIEPHQRTKGRDKIQHLNSNQIARQIIELYQNLSLTETGESYG
jgi:glycosyltransferase involved in cell wall biosynthesis